MSAPAVLSDRYAAGASLRTGRSRPALPAEGVLHHEELAMVRVGDRNLTAVVGRGRMGALGRFHRAEQARLPTLGDSDDAQRSLLRVGHVDMLKAGVVSDQVRALSNLESAKDPPVVGHIEYRDAASAGAHE